MNESNTKEIEALIERHESLAIGAAILRRETAAQLHRETAVVLRKLLEERRPGGYTGRA